MAASEDRTIKETKNNKMHRQQINIYKTLNDMYTYNNNILKVQNEIIIKQNKKKYTESQAHTHGLGTTILHPI